MQLAPRDESAGPFPAPGAWRPVVRDGARGANFACPGCGAPGGLGPGTNHEIGRDGVVSPSLVCDCGFHELVRLAGWAAH